jgi:RimJ/RimL family protein N-acetyltransferase
LHSPELHRLYTNPLVTKNLASADCKPLWDEKITDTIGQAVAHWRQMGFGYWVFHLKKNGQFVGRGGLTIHQFEGKEVVGLGYAVMPDYWNRGFATEIAAASLEVGFGHLGLAEIWSWALPDNRASQRIMEKLGFRYDRDFEFAGLLHRFYRLVAQDWGRYHGNCTLGDCLRDAARVD